MAGCSDDVLPSPARPPSPSSSSLLSLLSLVHDVAYSWRYARLREATGLVLYLPSHPALGLLLHVIEDVVQLDRAVLRRELAAQATRSRTCVGVLGVLIAEEIMLAERLRLWDLEDSSCCRSAVAATELVYTVHSKPLTSTIEED